MSIIGRPPKDSATRHRMMGISIHPDLIRSLKRLAAVRGWGMSQTVIWLLRSAPDPRWRSLIETDETAAPLAPVDYDDGVDWIP